LTHSFIKIKSGLVKIVFLAIGWGIAGAIFSANDYMSVAHFAKDFGINAETEYNFFRNLTTSVFIASVGGILIGATEVFYFQRKFRKFSLGKALTLKTLFYSSGLIILILIGSFIYHSVFSGRSIFDLAVLEGVQNHMFSNLFWAQVISWSAVILITQFVLIVSDKFGKGVLVQFLLGKYHKPKTETRIFMFLDIKSSTTIAEKIKHKKYFELLNDFFNDVTDPIIYNKGEIYQYVGDEITISWKLENKTENLNCINCFFEIDNLITKLRDRYTEKYSLVPEFKAGLHVGEVITGEVGVVKKEIVFSGDVLNTTSRIQAECNKLKSKLLISKDLLNYLNGDGQYKFTDLGSVKLRGKNESIGLYSVSPQKLLKQADS
jgi:adenylate cyclase